MWRSSNPKLRRETNYEVLPISTTVQMRLECKWVYEKRWSLISTLGARSVPRLDPDPNSLHRKNAQKLLLGKIEFRCSFDLRGRARSHDSPGSGLIKQTWWHDGVTLTNIPLWIGIPSQGHCNVSGWFSWSCRLVDNDGLVTVSCLICTWMKVYANRMVIEIEIELKTDASIVLRDE